MPIEFRGATPPDTQASYEYGQAQANQQNAGRQQRAYEQAVDASQRNQALALQQSGQQQQADQFAASLEQRAAMANQDSMDRRSGIEAQQGEANARRQQENQRMTMQFTQADNLRLQRIQQARSGARAALDAGELTQSEYREYIQSLNGAQEPLEQMRQYSQVQANRQLTMQREAAGRMDAIQAGTVRDFMQRSTLGPPVRVVEDPVTGEQYSEIERQPGRWEPLRGGGAGGGAGGTGGGGADGLNINSMLEAERHAREAHDRAETTRIAGMPNGGTPREFDQQAWRQDYFDLQDELRQRRLNAQPNNPRRPQQNPAQAVGQQIQQSVAQALRPLQNQPGQEAARGEVIQLGNRLQDVNRVWGNNPQGMPRRVRERMMADMERLQGMAAVNSRPGNPGFVGPPAPDNQGLPVGPPEPGFVTAASVRPEPSRMPAAVRTVVDTAREVPIASPPLVPIGGPLPSDIAQTRVGLVAGIPVAIPPTGPGSTLRTAATSAMNTASTLDRVRDMSRENDTPPPNTSPADTASYLQMRRDRLARSTPAGNIARRPGESDTDFDERRNRTLASRENVINRIRLIDEELARLQEQ